MKADIPFVDFQKLDLRVGKVLSAEAVAGSTNLLRLKVNLGNDHGVRIIISGIARWYTPATLKGKKFVFVTNLEPKKLMGDESRGMILCADYDHKAVVVPVNKKIPEGTIIR
ncbi:MAG: methionyl-tRNA synthetase, methionyl-tRNA synthetase [Candidatus Gottesmanbacteria bacterium GW2011_GWA2_43_14]|uniref:Methionine--tRNA ligase n=1 Tax=Candidatus Gottesmanbacteria bacterium GW2011_GWA2_43_14 TaxID=1618443 RepID=A0A0G1DJA2_9BACT|nr:MAG: methionyl-tRNA synthetase, methionyl-tRNA synthetase [Candidatus Gottesmanbacteria bacterium GW2011_GWA2_43_14]